MEIRRAFSGAKWEEQVGYCRAVRVGHLVFVTGTAPVAEDGSVVAAGDPYAQARRCLAVIKKALSDVDAEMSHIVRTRMFVTDIGQWEAFGRAHREVFSDAPPATTMVEVASLIDPAMLIEIEADAVCPA